MAGAALGVSAGAAVVGERGGVRVAAPVPGGCGERLAPMLVGAAAAVAAVGVLVTGDHVVVRWRDVIPLAGVTIDLDPFGAWFVLVAGVVIVAASVYAIGYCDHALARPVGAGHVSAVRGDAGAGARGGEHLDVPVAVGADGDDVAGARRGRAPRTASGTAARRCGTG